MEAEVARPVQAEKLAKVFARRGGGAAVRALEGLDLQVEPGEFLCVVGPSGCGKSTLLNLIAGLDSPSAGTLRSDGEQVRAASADRGMVFQSYALFPWLTVLENVAFGPRMQGMAKEKRMVVAQEYTRDVGLEGFAHSYPHELSGGMQQRVAVARAFAANPRILLMDEPFGSVDDMTRQMLQRLLLEVWQRHKKSIVFVTHSVSEAVYLADRIVVMTPAPGRVAKVFRVTPHRPRRRSDGPFVRLVGEIAAILEKGNGVQ